jgi:hypothetical protein
VFDDWWVYARDAYLDLGRDTPPETVTLYYDPLLDVHHKLPVMVAVINALYLAPQRPDEARRLFDAGVGMLGALGEGPPTVIGERSTGVALLLAREWGLDDTGARLAAGVEASYEPTWDRARGEFTWGFGLGEAHPRGQFNAIMAAAEAVTPGAWTSLATEAPPPEPGEVVGVDFPIVSLREAFWRDGSLNLSTSPMNDAVVGRPTSWRVIGLADPARWTATTLDNVPVETRVEAGDLVVETVVGPHAYLVEPR